MIGEPPSVSSFQWNVEEISLIDTAEQKQSTFKELVRLHSQSY